MTGLKTENHSKKISKKTVSIIASFLALGVLAFLLINKLGFFKDDGIRTAPAEMVDMKTTMTLHGTIEGIRRYDVCAESGYKVSSITVSEGDEVYEGQVLAEFDAEPLRKQYASSLVDYRMAEENVKVLRELYEIGAVSKKELNDAQSILEKATYACEAFDIDGAESVTSPIGGTVIEVNCSEGGYIMYSKTGIPAFVIEDRSELLLNAYVKEKDYSCVHVGQKVEVSADAMGNRREEGIVESVGLSAQVNKMTGTREIPVKIRLDNKSGDWATGITGQAKLVIDYGNVLAVPVEAVYKDDSGEEYVYVLKNDSYQKEYIVSGAKTDGYKQILEGNIAQFDQIVITPEDTVFGK